MLSGRYDFFFPYETSSFPMFRLFGTHPTRSAMCWRMGVTSWPRIRLIHETLAWLDKYQPVGR